jgi:hypothetical protein
LCTGRYRDIEYTVVQGIKRGVWKWSTSVEGTAVSGKEPSKAAAVVTVEKAIDRALDSKTVRLFSPENLDNRVRSWSDPVQSRQRKRKRWTRRQSEITDMALTRIW